MSELLREDKTAGVIREERPLRRARYWFAYGSGRSRVNIKLDAVWVEQASDRRRSEPVLVHRDERAGRHWWWYGEHVYIDDDRLDVEAVAALLHQREARDQATINRAKAELRGNTARPSRKPIPEAVRHEVWRRDGGKCVDCGSRERLEFDHIIPVSRGGSNTARNIELRCESCNRRKAASV